MSTGPENPRTQQSVSYSIIEIGANRDKALAQRAQERERDQRLIRNLWTFGLAIAAITIPSTVLLLSNDGVRNDNEIIEIDDDIDMLKCVASHQEAETEASRSGNVQLVTMAGCEAKVSPPQTTTIP